jgi:phosphate butyryltransferase
MRPNFSTIIDNLKEQPSRIIAVAWGHQHEVLEALAQAISVGLAKAIVFGDVRSGRATAAELSLDPDMVSFVAADNEMEAAKLAVAAVREKRADVLMKGLCATATLLKAVLDKHAGLRSARVLSHVGIFETDASTGLRLLSDPAMNIAPDLNEKQAILENAVAAAIQLGIDKPKVAVIAAVEKVNPEKMPATGDAALLSVMQQRGQLGNCIVDGPMAIDLAFSPAACRIKEFNSPVGGQADIALLPDIEAGNIFYKTLNTFTNADIAGLLLGASAPIVLTSRADSERSKFLSIAMALQVSA